MIIGVDHGFGYIKTVHSSFVAGVTPFGVEPPLKHNVLKYDGKKQLEVYRYRSNKIPMRPLSWRSPTEYLSSYTVQYV